jgi:transcriptional regulator with XRE-family HTH domain
MRQKKTIIQITAQQFDRRRLELGFSCAALATRTGLSLRTVQRVLGGEESDPAFSTVVALGNALGIAVRFDDKADVRKLRRRQAERKASHVLALVQGTSALEAQGLSPKAMRDVHERTVNELLAGSNKRLWAD